MYRLQTLGAVALFPDPPEPSGEPLLRGSKTLVLAAYLATRPDRSSTREHLAELFWPGVPSSRARRSLRQALYFLSHSGGEGVLETEDDRVRLDANCCALDFESFERALAAQRFQEAANLYTGPFLQGFDPGGSRELATWIESVRERLEVGYRQALTGSARACLKGGDPARAVEYARRAAAVFPLDDLVHALLLEVLTAAGRPGEAVREYEAYRVLLEEELEDVPAGDVTDMAEKARALVLSRGSRIGDVPPAVPTIAGTFEVRAADVHPTGPLPRPEPDPGPLGRTLLILMSATITATVLAVLINGYGLEPLREAEAERRAAAAAAGTPRVLVRGQQTTEAGVQPVTLAFVGPRPTGATIVPGSEGEVGELSLVSPDGSYEVRRVPTPNGPDLEIVDARTGARIVPVPNRDGRTPDDHMHAWSPDSRILLFSSGLFDEGGGYDHRHFLFEVETGRMWPLSDHRISSSHNEAWSPRGDRIAFVTYREGAGLTDVRTDIVVVTADGRAVARLTDDEEEERDLTWSPDGTRIAFVAGPQGSGDIRVVDLRTAQVETVAGSDWNERGPVWISDREIGYVKQVGDESDVWIVPADRSAPPRQVTRGLGISDLYQRLGPSGTIPWIESVEAVAAAPGGMVSPGAHTQLRAKIMDSDGNRVHPDAAGLEWFVLEPGRAKILEPNLLVASDTGTIRLVATVGGWRADTLVLMSRPLAVADAQLLLEERWNRGLSADTWETFGTPAPSTRPEGGPEGAGRFLNEGDENHHSGAVTSRRFPVGDGISVEAWGRAALTNRPFQTWFLGLDPDARLNPATDERLAGRAGKITLISSPSPGQNPTAILGGAAIELPVPEPAGIEQWRLHTLQLHPDGTVEWIVDGRRHASLRSDQPVPDSVHVGIGGRMVGTTIEHGPLRVWGGLRYVPEEDAPSTVGLDRE